MKENSFFMSFLSGILIGLAFLILIIGILIPDRNITNSYFDNTVKVEVSHKGIFERDTVTFIFTQPGEYTVIFFKIDKGDTIPQNFVLSLKTEEVPTVYLVKKYHINNVRIVIQNDRYIEYGPESHEFIR